MQVKVKVCGLSTPEAVDAAVKGGATHVGFVFSRRPGTGSVSLAQGAALATRVPGHVRKVGVFFEQDSIFFDQAIAHAGLHVLQLHATDPGQASNERLRTGRSVWGVATIRTAADLRAPTRWEGSADRILYDVKAPSRDWRMFTGIAHPLPWTLGGCLDQDNVADAVAITGARMIDISSGVDGMPSLKDPDRIAACLDAVRAIGR